MKLLIDTRWQGKHGIGRYACEILKRLNLSSSSTIEPKRSISQFSIKDLFYLAYLLRKKSIKGYYSFGANVPLLACVNKSIIITIHDLIPITSRFESSCIKKLYFEKILKPIIKRENVKIITVSNCSKNQIVEWSGVDSSRVIVAYNGISESFNYDSNIIKQKYFLYIGNRRTHKNVEIIFKAFRGGKYYAEYKLVFSGELDEILQSYAEKYSIPLSKIETIGLDVDDKVLAKYYQSATATVMPSLEEGFGLPLVESMACGTPVIASNIEVLQEIGDQGGVYFDPYSSEELSTSMQKIVDDKDLYAKKIEMCLKRAKDFDWDKTANIVREELTRLGLL